MFTYSYSPKKKSKKSKLNKKEREYVKTIVKAFILYAVVGISSFFALILIFSNINSLWGFFRPAEQVKKTVIEPSKPYLETENEFTNEDTVTLEGTAEAGRKVTLFKNGEEIQDTLADSENKFTFNSISIETSEEENKETEFYVIVEDENGVKSPPSNVVAVTYDNTKPELTVENPEPDERIRSFSRTMEVTGETEKDARVLVNEKIARTNLEGKFSATIALEDEVNTIIVKASDKAGNEEIIEIPVYFEKLEDD